MAWYINGKRIYVEEDTGWKVTSRLSEIDVLDSTKTIFHYAGHPSYTRSLTFVVFSGYYADILSLPLGEGVTLISDLGSESVIIKSIEPKRLRDISRTTAVMRCTMELAYNDA